MSSRIEIEIDEDTFIDDWEDGELSLSEIALKHGIGVSTAGARARELGCTKKTSGRRPGTEGDDPLSSPWVLTDGEWAVDDRGIMRWVAVGEPEAPKARSQRGVPNPKKGRRLVIDDAELVRLWDEGVPLRELRERFGCGEEALRGRAYRLGCSPRTPGRRSKVPVASDEERRVGA